MKGDADAEILRISQARLKDFGLTRGVPVTDIHGLEEVAGLDAPQPRVRLGMRRKKRLQRVERRLVVRRHRDHLGIPPEGLIKVQELTLVEDRELETQSDARVARAVLGALREQIDELDKAGFKPIQPLEGVERASIGGRLAADPPIGVDRASGVLENLLMQVADSLEHSDPLFDGLQQVELALADLHQPGPIRESGREAVHGVEDVELLAGLREHLVEDTSGLREVPQPVL